MKSLFVKTLAFSLLASAAFVLNAAEPEVAAAAPQETVQPQEEVLKSIIPPPKTPDKPYCSLKSTVPDKMVTFYREYNIPQGMEALKLTWSWKVTNLKVGVKPWFNARILIKFKDAAGKEVKPEPAPSYVSRDTADWQSRTNSFLVPSGAVKIAIMPCLFNVKAGEMVVKDVRLVKTDPAPLLRAKAEKERRLKARYVPDEPENRAKWPKEIKVAGNRLVTNDGTEVWLQGLNAGGLESAPNGDQIVKSTVVAIDEWKANCIRLPLKEDFWFGTSVYADDGGKAYRAAVDKIVRLAANRGVYVVLDLHRFRAPKAEHVAFWKDIAKKYANHPAILFDIFNEPYGIGWEVWRNGGHVEPEKKKVDESAFLTEEEKRKNMGFESVGMQALVEAVRSTGAKNIIIAGGIHWANDLTGIENDKGLPTYRLEDKTGNGIMYAWHTYHWHGGWSRILPVAAKHPIFLGEVGAAPREEMTFIPYDLKEDPFTFAPDVIAFVQKHHINWTAWCFHPKAGPCMITNWDYEPTPYWGAFVKRALSGEQFELKRMR